MKVLITGAGGQLGHMLARTARADHEVVAADRARLDLEDGAAIAQVVADVRPELVISAGAYTAVDRAEDDAERAMRVNRDAAGHLARAARSAGAALIQVSTDFVFDGTANQPIAIDAPTRPLGVYGRTKSDGEVAVMAEHPGALIVRTSWVHGAHGANFVKTMLRLMHERDAVRVVSDQIGAPTGTGYLARTIWALAEAGVSGIRHVSNAGTASWYDFAVAISEDGMTHGLLDRRCTVTPIRTADFPTPAARPAYSLLDCAQTWADVGAVAPHWRDGLRETLEDLKNG